MDEIELLTKQREEHQLAIDNIDRRLNELRLEAAMAKWGVFPGCIVKVKGQFYKVTHIDARWRDKPWLEGNPRKKDGTFGTARRNIYGDWELVTEKMPEPEKVDEGEYSSLTLKDIANRITDHLRRFEKMQIPGVGGMQRYYMPNAFHAGSKLGIRYISFQGESHLKKTDAIRYLRWLDAGNEGTHRDVK